MQSLEGVGAVAHVDEAKVTPAVLVVKVEDALGWLAVAAGTPGFLIVALHRLGQASVDDKAHVGLVNAHAKGNGGTDNRGCARGPRRLRLLAQTGLKACMIGKSLDASGLERGKEEKRKRKKEEERGEKGEQASEQWTGRASAWTLAKRPSQTRQTPTDVKLARHCFAFGAAQTVHNARAAAKLVLRHGFDLLNDFLALEPHFVKQVAPVEALLEDLGRLHAQRLEDVRLDAWRGSGRQCHDGHRGKELAQLAQPAGGAQRQGGRLQRGCSAAALAARREELKGGEGKDPVTPPPTSCNQAESRVPTATRNAPRR